MRYEVKPQGVCPSKISFDLNGNVVTNVSFTNGCNGNLKAISKVIDGMTVEQIEGYFRGNTCGKRTHPVPTSWREWCGRHMTNPDKKAVVSERSCQERDGRAFFPCLKRKRR